MSSRTAWATKLDVVVMNTCQPSAQEVEAGGSGIHGHPHLYSELKGSLGYMRPYLKKIRKKSHQVI